MVVSCSQVVFDGVMINAHMNNLGDYEFYMCLNQIMKGDQRENHKIEKFGSNKRYYYISQMN